MRTFIFLLASTVGSWAFQMSVDAGYMKHFTWGVPWVWGVCVALWAFWLISHETVKTKWLKGFHDRVGKGVIPIQLAVSLVVFLLVGIGLRHVLPTAKASAF